MHYDIVLASMFNQVVMFKKNKNKNLCKTGEIVETVVEGETVISLHEYLNISVILV